MENQDRIKLIENSVRDLVESKGGLVYEVYKTHNHYMVRYLCPKCYKVNKNTIYFFTYKNRWDGCRKCQRIDNWKEKAINTIESNGGIPLQIIYKRGEDIKYNYGKEIYPIIEYICHVCCCVRVETLCSFTNISKKNKCQECSKKSPFKIRTDDLTTREFVDLNYKAFNQILTPYIINFEFPFDNNN